MPAGPRSLGLGVLPKDVSDRLLSAWVFEGMKMTPVTMRPNFIYPES